jgi:hypothetical protein
MSTKRRLILQGRYAQEKIVFVERITNDLLRNVTNQFNALVFK